MEKLSFTIAEEADIPIVANVLSEATHTKVEHGDEVWGSEGWSNEEVRESMTESDVYLVHDGNELIGTVSMQWEDERNWGEQEPTAGYMHRLAIAEGFNGQGYGPKIVEWAADRVAQNGRQLLRLDCEEKNTNLCAYYEAQGFVKVGSRPVPEYSDYMAALYERPVEK